MRITAVETIPYRTPLRKPLRFASGEVDHIEPVLLRLRTDDGLVGTADIPPRPYTYGETTDSVTAIIGGVFTEALLGADPLDR
ncbi:enolase, partial [Burkholderia multivorans]